MSLKNLQTLNPLSEDSLNKMVFHSPVQKTPSPLKVLGGPRIPGQRKMSKSAESLVPIKKTTADNRKTRSSEKSPSVSISKVKSFNVLNGRSSPAKSQLTESSLRNVSSSVASGLSSLDRLENGLNGHQQQIAEDNINVVVRVRPMNERERREGERQVLDFPGGGQVLCDSTVPGQKQKHFSYNVVFEPAASHDDVFEYSGVKRLLEMAVEGFSCTAFCYGQTGSGKTHTLTGPPGLIENNPGAFSDDHGLVIRSFVYLFRLLQNHQTDRSFEMKASFLEIYNEKVIDLLNPGSARKPLAVRWSKQVRGFYVENLFTVDCNELDDLFGVLEEGMRNRRVGSHSMNEHSSRSHTILTVRIRSEQSAEGGVFITRHGKMNFVDLAGSEMTKKTHSQGKTLEEANNINKSLMVLGYCIASLSDTKRKGHIPYRDSKLTKLLADSLAGNGVTLMIACIAPSHSNVSETVNTLRYAARAKKIRTKPIVKMDPREALILSLKREVTTLQAENEHLKGALHLNVEQPSESASNFGDTFSERRPPKTPLRVNSEKLAELETTELVEMVRMYMSENTALRQENAEVFTSREMLIRDQEIVCRENERLLRKLEDVNSVCCRSPIIPARPTYSSEMFHSPSYNFENTTNIWTNPHASSSNSIVSSGS